MFGRPSRRDASSLEHRGDVLPKTLERLREVVFAACKGLEHGLCRLAAGAFRLRAPFERRAVLLAASQLHAHLSHAARRGRTLRDLRVGDGMRRIAELDAFEPIGEVVGGLAVRLDLGSRQRLEQLVLRGHQRLRLAGRRRVGIAGRDLRRAAHAVEPIPVLADELHAAGILVAQVKVGLAAVVGVVQIVGRMDVPELAARRVHPLARAGHAFRTGIVLAEPPLRDVEMVRAPVRDHAPAIRSHLASN